MKRASRSPRLIRLTLFCLTSFFALSVLAEPTPENFKVAFIGDLGISSASKKILQLIKADGAQLVLHQGDFDYRDNPAAWEHLVDSVLGHDFPYIASAGNHDAKDWFGSNGYRDRLEKRSRRVQGMACSGDHGVNGVCVYKGMLFITSGVGSIGRGTLPYLQGVLKQSDPFVWKICSWHKQQASYQMGQKKSEVPWDYYRVCRENGAIIAQGHEHSYSRTHTITSFSSHSILNRSNQLRVGPGMSFTFTQGLGGEKLRGQHLCRGKGDCPHWASIYTTDQGAEPAVLFCTFNLGGQENLAECHLKTISNKVIDQFSVVSENNTFGKPLRSPSAVKKARPTSIYFPTEMSDMNDVWVTKDELKECE